MCIKTCHLDVSDLSIGRLCRPGEYTLFRMKNSSDHYTTRPLGPDKLQFLRFRL